MKTVYILLLVWSGNDSITSQQITYQTEIACQQVKESLIAKWNHGTFADGHSGYLSAECVPVPQQ